MPLAEQLRLAQEAGDQERVTAIMAELQAAVQAAEEMVAAQPPQQGVVYPGFNYQPAAAGPPGALPGRPVPGSVVDSSFMAPTRAGQKVGPDGRVKVEARRVSMAGRQHVNVFDKWMQGPGRGAGTLDREAAKVEKEIAKNSYHTPRPGEAGARRAVAEKIAVYCGGCGRPFAIYPSEVLLVDGDGEWKCDRCIRRGR